MSAELTPADVERFRTIVAQKLGLEFDDGKLDQLTLVLRERGRCPEVRSPAAYLELLASRAGSEELGRLAEYLTVAETYFFRNPNHFRAFSEVVVPARLAANAGPLRILSAGCASGEEAYSLAIVLNERRHELAGRQLAIHAVDLNPAVIRKAIRASYSQWSLRSTSKELCERYFHRKDRDYQLEPAVREMVSFETRNLVGAAGEDSAFWADGIFDVIFFRNVMMYFSDDAARKAVAEITRVLAPGGYLFLGDAETLRGLTQEFHLRHTHDTFYYQRTDPSEELHDDDGIHDDGNWRPQPREVGNGEACDPLLTIADRCASIDRASQRIASAVLESAAKIAANGQAPVHCVETHAATARIDRSRELGMALDLLRQERLDDSIKSLAALPSESQTDPDVRLLHAVLLTNRGDVAQAETVCRQLLKHDEFNAGGHYLTALCREQNGDREGAIHHDQVAIYLLPAFAMPHLHLGLLARRAGDFGIARHELAEASILFACEDPSRILLFGGGFSRDGLVGLCRAELQACGGTS
jgi:chemotaxis protein methyltransferase CheR